MRVIEMAVNSFQAVLSVLLSTAAPVLSRGWRQAALILVLLCLLLFFGLLILAIVCMYQPYFE